MTLDKDGSLDKDSSNGGGLSDGDNFDGQGTSDFQNLNSVDTDDRTVNELGAKVIQNSTFSHPGSSTEQIPFDATQYVDSNVVSFDDANDTLVVEKAGQFDIKAGVAFSQNLSNGDAVSLQLRINGSNGISENKFVLGGSTKIAITTMADERLSIGDTISAYLFLGSAVDSTGDIRNYLSATHDG